MNRTRLLFSLFLITSQATVFIQPSTVIAATRSEDCAICGHVCCCPEKCAAILKERRANESHCDSGVKCQLGESAPAAIQLSDDITFVTPQAVISSLRDDQKIIVARFSGEPPLFVSPTPAEIPTPPPRLS